MKIAQKFKELSARFYQNKINISEGEEIREVFQFPTKKRKNIKEKKR